MNTINLFDHNLKYKDYDCSEDPCSFNPRPPLFNLYIQVTDICNSKCKFCDKANCIPKDKNLDVDKFTRILKELFERNLLGRIALTGGEPLLQVNRLNQILNIIYDINPNAFISLNTNSSQFENFKYLQKPEFIKEIDISRHHYNQDQNNEVFGIKVANLEEIKNFSEQYHHINLKLNCVMTKKLINSTSDIEKYLEIMGQHKIQEVRFISLLNLTDEYYKLHFDVNDLIKYFTNYTNIGNLYDKDICHCFGFMYITSNGFPISAFIRNTKKAKCNYMRQLVYTPENYLLNGFNGKIII